MPISPARIFRVYLRRPLAATRNSLTFCPRPQQAATRRYAMTPQERQLVDDLFDRLAQGETAPRDPDATAAMQEGLRKAPNALYALVQTVLVQDEALKRANARIQELEQAHAGEPQQQSGGFLDSMRDTIFGKEQRGSVPNVPP